MSGLRPILPIRPYEFCRTPCPTLRSALRNRMSKMTALSPKTCVLLLILLTPFALGVDTGEVRGHLLIGRPEH